MSITNATILNNNINMSENYTITNIKEPVNNSDCATKYYVDNNAGAGFSNPCIVPYISTYPLGTGILNNVLQFNFSIDQSTNSTLLLKPYYACYDNGSTGQVINALTFGCSKTFSDQSPSDKVYNGIYSILSGKAQTSVNGDTNKICFFYRTYDQTYSQIYTPIEFNFLSSICDFGSMLLKSTATSNIDSNTLLNRTNMMKYFHDNFRYTTIKQNSSVYPAQATYLGFNLTYTTIDGNQIAQIDPIYQDRVPAQALGSSSNAWVNNSSYYLGGDGVWYQLSNTTIADGSIYDVKLNSNANIARNKLGVGSAGYVLINDSNGRLSQEITLSSSRGGTNIDSSSSTGIAKVSAGTWSISTLTNSDIPNNITRSKLANGTASRILYNDNSGIISELQYITDTYLQNNSISPLKIAGCNSDGSLYLANDGTFKAISGGGGNPLVITDNSYTIQYNTNITTNKKTILKINGYPTSDSTNTTNILSFETTSTNNNHIWQLRHVLTKVVNTTYENTLDFGILSSNGSFLWMIKLFAGTYASGHIELRDPLTQNGLEILGGFCGTSSNSSCLATKDYVDNTSGIKTPGQTIGDMGFGYIQKFASGATYFNNYSDHALYVSYDDGNSTAWGGANGSGLFSCMCYGGQSSVQTEFWYYDGSASSQIAYISDSGTYNVVSSKKVKKNIEQIENEEDFLNKLCKLKLYKYNHENNSKHKIHGFISEEVQDVFEGVCIGKRGCNKESCLNNKCKICTYYNEKKLPLSINYTELTNINTICIKTLNNKVDKLISEIHANNKKEMDKIMNSIDNSTILTDNEKYYTVGEIKDIVNDYVEKSKLEVSTVISQYIHDKDAQIAEMMTEISDLKNEITAIKNLLKNMNKSFEEI